MAARAVTHRVGHRDPFSLKSSISSVHVDDANAPAFECTHCRLKSFVGLEIKRLSHLSNSRAHGRRDIGIRSLRRQWRLELAGSGRAGRQKKDKKEAVKYYAHIKNLGAGQPGSISVMTRSETK